MFNFIKNIFSTPKPQKKKSSFLDGTHTIGQMQEKHLDAWGDDDILDGVVFGATLQLRTPLEVLQHHGEVFKEKNQMPPNYAKEMWHGIWLPKTKSYKELGLNIDEADSDFPHSFFYKQLTLIDGVGVKSAKLLYENGFKTVKDLQNAKDEELLKIKGIGENLVMKIRKYLENNK